MDTKQFWAVIDKARKQADGWEDMYDPLVGILATQDTPDILKWKQIFDEYQHLSYKNKLWAAAYIINGGCSDDGFDYFRGWLTAQGKNVFLKALKNPDSLADVEACEGDVEFEDILGAPSDAYFKKLNIKPDYDRFYAELEKHPLPDADKSQMAAEITYAKDIDAEWDDEDDESLSELLPKLCKAFDW